GDLKPHRRLVRHGVGTAAATRFPEPAPLHPRRDDVPRRAGPVARGAPASGGHGRVVYAGVDIKSRRAVVELVPPAHDPGFRCAGRDIRARPYEEIIALRPEWHAGADDKGKITIVCIVGRKDEARMSTGGPHLWIGP